MATVVVARGFVAAVAMRAAVVATIVVGMAAEAWASPVPACPVEAGDAALDEQIAHLTTPRPELAEAVWEGPSPIGARVRPEFRERIYPGLVEAYLAGLGVPGLASIGDVEDVVLAGSLTTLYYHPGSDIDIHVYVDGSKVTADRCAAFMTLHERSKVWSAARNERVDGRLVNFDVLDPACAGQADFPAYSLMRDAWREPPRTAVWHDPPVATIEEAARTWRERIDAAVAAFCAGAAADGKSLAQLDAAFTDYRRAGFERNFDPDGFVAENVTYKALRNLGYVACLRAPDRSACRSVPAE